MDSREFNTVKLPAVAIAGAEACIHRAAPAVFAGAGQCRPGFRLALQAGSGNAEALTSEAEAAAGFLAHGRYLTAQRTQAGHLAEGTTADQAADRQVGRYQHPSAHIRCNADAQRTAVFPDGHAG